jgi:ADP-heptose:LPS heptosyltransferase
MRRILIVKLADLGDLLICEPAIRSLRSGFPDAAIDVLTPPASAPILSLFDHQVDSLTFPKHLFDRVSGFRRPRNLATAARFARRLRSFEYDAVVLLHHLTTAAGAIKFRALSAASGASTVAGLDNGRGAFLTHRATDFGFGAKHESSYMLDVALSIGGKAVDPCPRIPIPVASLPPEIQSPYVVIAPATGPYSSARMWPAERFAEVARTLRSDGWHIVLVGATDAVQPNLTILRQVPDALDLAKKTSLPQLAAVIGHASLTIAGDTFPGHLASALARPVVSIFGPSNDLAWRPWGSARTNDPQAIGSRSLIVRYDVPCSPCLYSGYALGRPDGCPARTCLKMVSTADVVMAARRALEATAETR